jgi:hypothetical protein
MQSVLARKIGPANPIGTGNDQETNREWNSLLAEFCGGMSHEPSGVHRLDICKEEPKPKASLGAEHVDQLTTLKATPIRSERDSKASQSISST